jgi:hypothetical protein
MKMSDWNSDVILEQVRTQYSAVATRGLSSEHAGVRSVSSEIHGQLADLLRKFDVNAFAASMKIFAVTPQ